MAISTGKHKSKYDDDCETANQTTFVKEIYVNSEDVEKELNQWLKDNEANCIITDIKVSSCYFRDLQTKTIVLIFYKKIENK